MSTLKEQLDAEREAKNQPREADMREPAKPILFGNPYREEYIKNAEAIKEKLIKRGKAARRGRMKG